MTDLSIDSIEARRENDIHRYSSLAPKPFSGHLQEDFTVFLDRLNQYFGSMNLTDEQKLAKFPLCLSSQAFIDNKKADDATRNDYGVLTERFKITFGS